MPSLGLGLSPRYTNRKVTSVWTPADIANLTAFWHLLPGKGCCFASSGGAASVADETFGYAAPLFGTSISASEATNKPTLRANGMELDAAGVNLLTLSTPIPGNGAFTVYWSLIVATGSGVAAFMEDSVGQTILGGAGDISIFDTNSTPAQASVTLDALALGRFATDGLNGNFSVIGTSQAEATGAGAYQAFPFSQIGGTGAVGSGNDSTSNRFRLCIWIDRYIALGSAEDLLIRAWITANDGATL